MVSDLARRKRVGLCLTAAFRHGFREVGEEDREPQPQGDLQVEGEVPLMLHPVRDQTGSVVSTLPTSTTNMTGFFIMVCGASFDDSVGGRSAHDLRIEERLLVAIGTLRRRHLRSFVACLERAAEGRSGASLRMLDSA